MLTTVCFFFILAVSVAKGGDLYLYNSRNNYENNQFQDCIERGLFEFSYHSRDMLKMDINLKNIPKNVSVDVLLKYYLSTKDTRTERTPTKGEKYFMSISNVLTSTNIRIELELSTKTGFCDKKLIVKAKLTHIQNDEKYNDVCLKDEPCIIEVDLSNNVCTVPIELPTTAYPFIPTTTTPLAVDTNTMTLITTTLYEKNEQPSSQNSDLIYVIPSVIVTCVIILVVYISVKKYYLRNSQPAGEGMELNTDATANEVVYADLSLVPGNSQPPNREESPYAQIIGVMKPVPS